MKTPKGLKLKLGGGSKPYILQFKTNKEERDYFNSALNKLNEISILKFTISDLQRMALQDLSTRILNEKIVISLDIPERTITFNLTKTKRL